MQRALRFVPVALVLGWISWGLVPRRLPHPEALDALPVPVATNAEGRTAAEILALVRAAYASAEAYRDEGWIRNVRIRGNDRDVHSVESFRVALLRPDHLVWQWRELNASRRRDNEFVDLLQLGDGVRFRSARWGEASLQERKDAFARIAAGDFRYLLQLLFPREMSGGALLERLAEARVVGIERFGGHDCLRIEGTWSVSIHEEPARYVLWVDCDSYHLRRLTEHIPFGDWISESTFVFSPQPGVEIAQSELALDEGF